MLSLMYKCSEKSYLIQYVKDIELFSHKSDSSDFQMTEIFLDEVQICCTYVPFVGERE